MNIQKEWDIGGFDTYNPQDNIELGTIVVKRILNSLENPTPAKVGTLWNSIRQDVLTSKGLRFGRAYKEQPWKI